MAMSNTAIVSAMTSILGATPTAEQQSQMETLADAIIATISTATINYVSGLANSGGPVTGVFVGTLT